jgi:hypothetical protein
MVGVTRTDHRRFAYEKQRHYPSRSRHWCSGDRRSCCRHCRRCRGTELHDERHDPVHKQYGDYPVDDNAVEHHHDTVNDDTEDADGAAGIHRSPVPEHGQQVWLGFKLGLWLELGFGLRRRPSGRRHRPVVTAPWGNAERASRADTRPGGFPCFGSSSGSARVCLGWLGGDR